MKKIKSPEQPIRHRRDSANLPRGEAFSYYSARNNQSSEDTNTTVRQSGASETAKDATTPVLNHWWKHLPTIISTIVILFCFGYELVLTTNPKIVILKDDSANFLLKPPVVYINAASKLFKQSLSDQNKLTINTGYISERLQKMFPELNSVSVTLPVLGHRPIIYLDPATPSLILDTQSSGDYLIDSYGKALVNLENVKVPQSVSFYTVKDQTGLKVNVGQDVLSTSDINFIQYVAAETKANSLNIKYMILPPQSRELDIYFNNEPYYVKFNLDTSSAMKQQVGTFLATREYLIKSNSPTPSQYIDVRVTGRAYYK